MSTSERSIPGWLLPVGLAALVVVLVAIALVRGPVEFDPETPEGTVQEYLLAVNEERWDDAVSIIQEDWLGSCEGADLEIFAPGNFSAELGADEAFGRAGFDFEGVPPEGSGSTTTLPQSTTQVEVTIHHSPQGDLTSGWSEPVVFELIREEDFWWLTNDPWPYFIWNCREG